MYLDLAMYVCICSYLCTDVCICSLYMDLAMYMLSVYAHMYVCSYSIFSIYELFFCSWIYAKENEGGDR